MKKIHVAVFLGPASAEITPALSIVSVLVRRGYRVTCVAPKRFASEIIGIGAEMLECPGMNWAFIPKNKAQSRIDIYCSTDEVDLASRTLSLVLDFYDQNIPNVVLLSPGSIAGLALAAKYGIPAILLTSTVAFNEELWTRYNFSRDYPHFENLKRKIEYFCRSHGIEGQLREAIPTIYFYLSDFQLNPLGNNRPHLYAARCASERPYRQGWKSKCLDGRKRILVSASTVYEQETEYYKLLAETLLKLQFHVILALGINNDISFFDSLKSRCEVVQHVPVIALMPYADLVICMGGMATTMEALYHGLPIIALSHGYAELEMYADSIQSNDVGLHLKGAEAMVDNVKECAIRIFNDVAFLLSVKKMQERLRVSTGAEGAANWIERFLIQ